MNTAKTLELACKALGWQGGTIHDAAKALGVDSNDLLYGNAEGVGDMESDFTYGWMLSHLGKPIKAGNLQIVFGYLSRMNLTDDEAREVFP
jgi:hypothetical protein